MFGPADATGPGSDPLVVLSHRLWLERFGGDASVIGQVVRLNGHPFTVVGVAPAGVHRAPEVRISSRRLGADDDARADHGRQRRHPRRPREYLAHVAGRLGPGIDLAAADARLAAFASAAGGTYPETIAIAAFVCWPAGPDSTIPTSLRHARWP